MELEEVEEEDVLVEIELKLDCDVTALAEVTVLEGVT